MNLVRHGSVISKGRGPRLPLPRLLRCLAMLVAGAIFSTPCFAKDVITLKSRELAPYEEAVEGFKSTVRARVRTLAMNVDKDYNEADVLERLRDQNFDLIYALGAEALQLAAARFPDSPIVYSFVLDPGAIIEQSGRAHRKAIHGISMNVPPEQQLKTLSRIAPQIRKVGVVFDKSKSEELVARARAASRQLGLTLVEKPVVRKQDTIDAITALQGQVECILMLPDVTVITAETVKYLLLFSFRTSIPLIGISEKYVAQGALFALSFDIKDLGRQAGEMATQLLSGKDGADNALTDPESLKLSINQKTAAKFGINIPAEVLKAADHLY